MADPSVTLKAAQTAADARVAMAGPLVRVCLQDIFQK